MSKSRSGQVNRNRRSRKWLPLYIYVYGRIQVERGGVYTCFCSSTSPGTNSPLARQTDRYFVGLLPHRTMPVQLIFSELPFILRALQYPGGFSFSRTSSSPNFQAPIPASEKLGIFFFSIFRPQFRYWQQFVAQKGQKSCWKYWNFLGSSAMKIFVIILTATRRDLWYSLGSLCARGFMRDFGERNGGVFRGLRLYEKSQGI